MHAVYRIIASAFVHGGLLHVALNMLAFVPIGTSLERMQGTLALTHLTAVLLLLGGGCYIGLAADAQLKSVLSWSELCHIASSGGTSMQCQRFWGHSDCC